MGWTCQHDHQGYCKLVKKEDDKKEKEIDFAALVRSH
jgi:hypothetical protein